MRPLLWIPAVALFEAGRAHGLRARASDGWPVPAPSGPEALAGAALLLLLGAVHLANGWADRAGDAANRKGWPVAGGSIGGRTLAALAAGALLGAATLSLGAGPSGRGLLAAGAILGAAYTAPGVALKRRPGFDLVANAAGYGGVAFLLGAAGASRAGISATSLLACAAYGLGIANVSLFTMLADREGDRAAGLRTTAVVLGPTRARTLGIALAWGTALAGLLAREWVPALWGVVAGTAWGGRRAPRGSAAWNRAARAGQALVLALLALSGAWLPLAFAVAVAGASALYYRDRIGVPYPLNEAFACRLFRRSDTRSGARRCESPSR